MVEGARLEVVCARDGTEGSNPSLSVPGAMQSLPFEPRQVWKEAAVNWLNLCRSFPGFLFINSLFSSPIQFQFFNRCKKCFLSIVFTKFICYYIVR